MMKLIIVTPQRKVLHGTVIKSITVPGSMGEMTILPGHARLVSLLESGIIRFETSDGKIEVGAVSTGMLEVHQDEVTLLAETLELAHEIDLERARKAKEKAEACLKAKETFDEDLVKWQRKLERAHIRLLAAQHLLPPH